MKLHLYSIVYLSTSFRSTWHRIPKLFVLLQRHSVEYQRHSDSAKASPPHRIQESLSRGNGGWPILRLTPLKTGVTQSWDARPYSAAALSSRHASDSLLGAVGLSGVSPSPQAPLHVSLLASTSLPSIVALQLWILRELTYSAYPFGKGVTALAGTNFENLR